MTKATQILRNEHEAILKMLDAVNVAADRLDRVDLLKPETLSGILEFLQIFADQCHHGKEEEILFPALAAKGMPHEGGPLAVMEFEHRMGRSLVRQLEEATYAYAEGDLRAGFTWAQVAREYGTLLRNHIAKENNVLFVMAERMLTEDEQISMAEQFERAEIEKMGAGMHEHLHRKMEALLASLQPEGAAVTA